MITIPASVKPLLPAGARHTAFEAISTLIQCYILRPNNLVYQPSLIPYICITSNHRCSADTSDAPSLSSPSHPQNPDRKLWTDSMCKPRLRIL